MNNIKKNATLDNLEYFLDFLCDFASRANIKNKFLLDLTVVIEELVINIISYGYPYKKDIRQIELHLSTTPKEIIITITDNGIPFNILEVEEPNINPPLQEREIGGMGIHLIKTLTDKIEYKRINEKNILTLTKTLTKESTNC